MMHSPKPADLLESARAALRDGERARADTLFAALLDADPQSFEALTQLGQSAFAAGRLDVALDLLGRAQRLRPADAHACKNLGAALRAAGNNEVAVDLLREAVRLDPNFFVARLLYAAACEDLGRTQTALCAYYGALNTAQRQGRWLNTATTAPLLRPLVTHAMHTVDAGRGAFYANALDPLRERFGAEALRRVEKALEIYLGNLPADYPDPRQKPSFLYFPDIPSQPWFERSLFPWYEEFESHAPAIRRELDAVLDDEAAFAAFLKARPNVDMEEYLSNARGPARWDGYFFYDHGERFEENCRRCPETAAALDRLPLVRLPAHAPECLFSKLTAGSHIRPHRGVTNTRLVTHLPLIVPGNGALRVGGEDHVWQQGRCITFDDTFLHEAWNFSDHTRVVLLFDVWNPHMTEAEVAACSQLVLAISGFNREAMLGAPMQETGEP